MQKLFDLIGRRTESLTTAATHQVNNFLEARQGHATWPPRQHKLDRIRIGDVLDATQVGNHHGDRTSHPNPATDHHPLRWQIRFNPFYGLRERHDPRLSKLLQWDLGIDDPIGDRYILLFSYHQDSTHLRRRVSRIIGITNKQSLMNHVHAVVSIEGTGCGSRNSNHSLGHG